MEKLKSVLLEYAAGVKQDGTEFNIRYSNGDLVGFNKTEEFMDYDDAYYWCVTKNKFGVAYPNLITIKSI